MMAFIFEVRKMELKNYSSFTKKEIVNAFCRLQQKIWLSIIIFILGIAYIAYGIYTIINNDYKFIFLFAGIGFIAVSLALVVIPYFLALKANKDINGIDYELSYADNIHAGSAVITISGKGNYTGSITKNFTIVKKALLISSESDEKVFDYSDAGKIQVIRKYGNLEIEEYREDGIFVKGTLPSEYESYCLGR